MITLDTTVGSFLHPDPGSRPPQAHGLASPPALLTRRPETIAHTATTGLMTHPDIDDAVVSVHGPRRAPRLHIECLLAEDGDALRTTELIISVRNQLESMLDVTFDTAEMTIRHAA